MKMARLNIAGMVFTAILLQCSCSGTKLDCNDMFPESPQGQNECYYQGDNDVTTGETDCESMYVDNTFIVEDTTSGTVSFTFDMLPNSCMFKHYFLTLFIDESVTSEEQCSGITYFESQHSFRTMKILRPVDAIKIETSPCEQKITVTFNYIYTACYMLDIVAKKSYNGDDSTSNYSQPILLRTEYKKHLLIGKKPTISSQYRPVEHELQIAFQLESFEELFEDLHMGIRLQSDINQSAGRPCYETGKEHSCCSSLTSGNFMCKLKNEMANKPKFELRNNEMMWTIENVTNGNYCILVEFFDDRCEQSTVWNNDSSCLYNSRVIEVPAVELPYPLRGEDLPMKGVPLFAILLTSSSILLVVCVCVMLFVWRRRQPRQEPGGNCDVKRQPPSNRPQILLLYARDCKPFMDLMVTFREILKEETKCEVIDCFDQEFAEDISRGQVDWLTRHIISSEMKVVLVETECAVFHQQALLKHQKICYTKPRWVDNLFDYGLKVLRDNLEKSTYQKVFVVRVQGYTEEKSGVLQLTPYTRYVIPQNLEKLLSSLYQRNSTMEYVLILDETNDSHLQKLHESIRNYENYKRQNQDYLRTLLTWK